METKLKDRRLEWLATTGLHIANRYDRLQIVASLTGAVPA